MTSRTPRPVPRLASDIARSWVAIGLGLPLMVGVAMLAVIVPGAFGLTGPEDASSVINGTFYIAWTGFCLANVLVTVATFHRADSAQLRAWLDATQAPEGRLRHFWWAFNGGGAITWAVTGSIVALLALLEVALSAREMPLVFVVAGVAVVPASIAVIIVTFAVSHARADGSHGFRFPGTDAPRFADYLYLSIQLTTTFGGSDVEVTTTRLRRAVSVHSLLAFAYNAFVIALLVSAILNAVPRT